MFNRASRELAGRSSRGRVGSQGGHSNDVELAFPVELYDQVPEAVAVFTREARYVYVNPIAEQLLARKLSDLRGRLLWDVVADAVGEPYRRAFERVVRSGSPERFAHLYPPWNRWFDHRLYLAGGQIWTIATDITAQKDAEELERARAARLRILAEASRALAEATLDVGAVLDTVVTEVTKHLGDGCSVSLVKEDDAGHLQLAAFHHPNPEAKAWVTKLLADAPQRVGESIAGSVVATGAPVLLAERAPEHIAAALRVEYRQFAERFPIYGVLAVPLRARGRVIGSIQACRFTPGRPYNSEDQRLLEELADRSALAIENARLHRQMRTHAQVLESMSEGVLVSDENGFILYTNPAEDRMFGYAGGELVGKHVTELNTYPREENERIVREVIGQLRATGIWSGEWSNVRKDATTFVSRAHITALDLEGMPHLVCVQEDVTEQRRIEQERATLLADARRAREQLQLIIDAVPVLISYVDAEGRYRLNNLTYEKWFGRSREELYGKHMREVVGDAAFDTVRPDIERALSGSPVTYERELPYIDAGCRWVQGTCIPDIDGTGAVRGFIALVQDIGERKQHEEQLRRKAEFEQHVLGIVSHDLRNPLSVMLMSAAALLRREGADAKTTSGLRRIVSSGERALRMIGDLLDFTQARVMGGIPLECRPFDFHVHVRRETEELQAAHPNREILITASGDGQGTWDPDRVTQVVVNLVGNALAYSPETTPVRVRTCGDEQSLLLEVHNRGTPILAETMQGLFEPFKRGQERSGSTGRSVGLGLYIVKQLVLAHGGSIELTSTEAEGTTFSVRLPRRAVGLAR